jgi:hypothetical protein
MKFQCFYGWMNNYLLKIINILNLIHLNWMEKVESKV